MAGIGCDLVLQNLNNFLLDSVSWAGGGELGWVFVLGWMCWFHASAY